MAGGLAQSYELVGAEYSRASSLAAVLSDPGSWLSERWRTGLSELTQVLRRGR